MSATRPRPLVLGVLGGIGSGKSRVARELAGPGGVVVDADRLAGEVLDSPEVTARIREAWGRGALDADGRPDRTRLAERVFVSAGERARLEGWIHPRVRERILAALADAEARGVEIVVLDVPLLLENDPEHGLAGRCDRLVFVDAPAEERDRRAAAQRGWSPGEVARREAAQLPLEEKRSRADHVIANDGTLDDLAAAVAAVLADLRRA